MKITVYDPLKAFPAFLDHLGSKHDVLWVDVPVSADELRWQHIRSDLVWYEFCDEVFFQMMRGPKECAIVNRLHSYELFTDVPGRVNWTNVDLLVGSSDFVSRLLLGKRDVIDFPPVRTLANGPDLSKIKFAKRSGYGKRIGLIGRINYKKNVPLAIYCMARVPNDYELHVFGGSQDLRFDFYLSHIVKNLGLEDRVFFHGEVPSKDLMEYLGGIDYILSTSLFESFGQGIMEGIASGCLPIIHDFPGARERFAGMDEAFFTTPDQFAECLLAYWVADKDEIAKRNRGLIEHYSLDRQIASLDAIIAEIEDGIHEYKR